LISLIFRAFSISVERVVINDLRNDTYYARLTLKMGNEVHTRISEIDARPSDCIAIALEAGKKIFVASKVWNEAIDVTETLVELKEKMEHGNIDELFGNVKDEDDDDDQDDDEEGPDQEIGKS
jgi:bifunctional DNase/RNase